MGVHRRGYCREVKLTQSNAIMRYIARKHNMTGDGVLEAVADMFADQLMDLRNVFVSVVWILFPLSPP